MFADPLNETPAIVLAVSNIVADPALPVALAATTDKLSINDLSTYASIFVATLVSV